MISGLWPTARALEPADWNLAILYKLLFTAKHLYSQRYGVQMSRFVTEIAPRKSRRKALAPMGASYHSSQLVATEASTSHAAELTITAYTDPCREGW